ncbi:hypothetical protein HBH64_123810 [Parastagonospora nodorum]|nr:hypothetical protein HBH54_168420 [Parastagonospora nodorum]KAH3965709.1 hypothetical protein HBH52_205080 [Parastagonospora nodorum]KAH4133858.1 hypothetical protein HBH45_172140 [Parastagonospora nodorum]KAH4318165.1 hypothetical protein HBI02_019280 [Parastagonospora nodorum]KAH4327065.1 hypothetical protein HBI00_135770 [Parastagonospora nodorum]
MPMPMPMPFMPRLFPPLIIRLPMSMPTPPILRPRALGILAPAQAPQQNPRRRPQARENHIADERTRACAEEGVAVFVFAALGVG